MLRIPKNRRFNLTARYSEPDTRDRIKFTRKTFHNPGKGRGIMFYLVLAAAFFLIYMYISNGISLRNPDNIQLQPENAIETQETELP